MHVSKVVRARRFRLSYLTTLSVVALLAAQVWGGGIAWAVTPVTAGCTGTTGDMAGLAADVAAVTTGQTAEIDLVAGCTYTFDSTTPGPLTLAQGITLTIEGNGATITGAAGGAIVSGASGGTTPSTLTVDNVTFSGNSAYSGGAIYDNMYGGTLHVTNSTFSNNSAVSGNQGGGAIYVNVGTVTIDNSTFASNHADKVYEDGGAIFNSGATITITNSTFSGNTANGSNQYTYGGAIYNNGSLNVTNSTFSGNSAGDWGGAIDNYGGRQVIRNTTFSGNTAGVAGAAFYSSYTTLTLSGNLFDTNTVGGALQSCVNSFGITLNDQGYNVADDATCFNGGTGDLTTPPAPAIGLGSLASNGGPTQTMAITSVSSAYHAVAAAQCPATDQRGHPRLAVSTTLCDAGAFEVDVATVSSPALTVTKSVTSFGPYNTVGQTITYQFVAKNTGNVTLSSVGITDTQSAPAGSLNATPACQSLTSPTGSCSGTTTTLLPNQSATFIGTYTITQADLNNGSVADSATASGTPPAGGSTTSPPSNVTVPLTQSPALTVTKSVTSVGPYNTVGQTISYQFVATNTGNVTLSSVGITDAQTAPAGSLNATPACQSLTGPTGSCSGTTTTLLPDQSATFIGTYTITQADLNNGSVADSATASGTPPAGGSTTSQPSRVTVTTASSPAITSASNATFTIGTAGTFTVTTTGTQPLTLSENGALPAGVTFIDNGNGTAILSGTPTGTGGSYPITFTANNGVSPNATQNFVLTVEQATTTTLSSNCMTTFVFVENNPQPFTITATVSGANPTDSVTFNQGSATLCSNVSLSSGNASCTTNALATSGSDTQDRYALTASYSGDAINLASTSAPFYVTLLSAADVVFRNGFELETPTCPIE